MIGFDDWFPHPEDDESFLLDALYEDAFHPDEYFDEDKLSLWDDEDAEENPKPDARERDVFEMDPDEIERFLDLVCSPEEEDQPIYPSITRHPIYSQLRDEKQNQLKRELKAAAMERIEEAARTVRDFEQVITLWDSRDKSAARSQRNHEALRGDMPTEANPCNVSDVDLIIPEWMNDPAYRQIMRGSFLDYLYDCPYEMHDLTEKDYLRIPVMELKDLQKEILYFLYLRLYKPQRLATLRGQTDRNIRKVRDTALRKLRSRVYANLRQRVASGQPLTLDERVFLEECTPEGIRKNIRKEGA